MRNLAAKFAMLSARFQSEGGLDTQGYLDLLPDAMLARYKQQLSLEENGALLFGFSDQAILDILDAEFEIDLERHALLFRKTYLDAQSIRLAGSGRNLSADAFSIKTQNLASSLSEWLFEATRSLYRGDLNDTRLKDIHQEYQENFLVYAVKVAGAMATDEELQQVLKNLYGSVKTMMSFCHALTVDALFKSDAAKVLFGEQSAYCQAWLRKQIFRHMMAKSVEDYIQTCLVD